ncbi:vitelline envelope sperm lysin receptor-like isoform X2 [Mytilus californianus]|uniref:vitelline envelope sperm lysin receptor-like isoform X2 n=1 Tax=Mytilus californianus TaxID=6549 RepID=UPI0022450F5D|nr:vitelline envelope sperm lysin receptor-like isoform X2 [Mytilus californianus]
MFILQFLTCLLLAVAARSSVPEGYILDVSQSCGEKMTTAGQHYAGTGANVTIKSDLYVQAQVKCQDGLVQLDPIDETNTETSLRLCYSNDSDSSCPCKFNTPSGRSNFYSAVLQVFWGFKNGTLMNEFETYTISCIAEGNKTKVLENKDIDEHLIPVKSEVIESFGHDYTGTAVLELFDVLGNKITATKVPMSKKVQLKLTVTTDQYYGVVPYDCRAISKDRNTDYRFLLAGCGDGTIIPTNKGFTTDGKISKSPFFKLFKLLESSEQAGVSYECSFTVCNASCDVSSCSVRTKRSADSLDQERVKTPIYQIQRLEQRVEDRLDQSQQELSDLKMDTRLKLATLEIVGIGAVALLSLVIATYSCIRVEQKRLREKVSLKMSSA